MSLQYERDLTNCFNLNSKEEMTKCFIESRAKEIEHQESLENFGAWFTVTLFLCVGLVMAIAIYRLFK